MTTDAKGLRAELVETMAQAEYAVDVVRLELDLPWDGLWVEDRKLYRVRASAALDALLDGLDGHPATEAGLLVAGLIAALRADSGKP